MRRRDGKRVASRRVFYDFATSPPNSGSLVAMLRDYRIVDGHERAGVAARTALERFAEIRIRRASKSAVSITLGLCPPPTAQLPTVFGVRPRPTICAKPRWPTLIEVPCEFRRFYEVAF